MKCPGCAKKIERKFNFGPYCGLSFKKQKEGEDFGMIGRDDFAQDFMQGSELKMPFGLDKVMSSLVKQLEKQMSNNNNNSPMPRGFKIQISTGKPQVQKVHPQKPAQIQQFQVSPEESEKRQKLPKIPAESRVRRLADRIIYEIPVPGVNSKKDVVITKLAEGLEIKAYSNNRCYVKSIPLKVEIIGYSLKDDILFVEFKG